MQTKPKILLIDDEKGILDTLTIYLGKKGFLVETATDGEEAFHMILQRRYDGAVSDWKMPRLDGLGLLKRIRGENIVMPFVFLSGHADIGQEHEMANYGAYRLVHKMDFKTIPDVLKSMLVIDNRINSVDEQAHKEVEFLELLNNISKVS